MSEKDAEIFYDCTQETRELIGEQRRVDKALSSRGDAGDKLTARLSDVAGAVYAIIGLDAISKGMQTCVVAQRHFEGYEVKEQVKREEFKIPYYDTQAVIERAREHALYESLKKTKFEEFARLDARDEWEASKQAAAPVVAVGASVIVHSTRVRRDTLTPVIERAQSQCQNPRDTAEVWAELQGLANRKTAPLIGATEDGLQYLKNGEAEIFKRKSLGQRLAR